MKKFICFAMSLILSAAFFAGCKNGKDSVGDSDGKTETYNRDEGLVPDSEDAFFDDFTDREYSAGIWNVMNSKWGPAFNHGVRPENVGWNDSGVVTIRSFGKYYGDANKTCQGGCLITKKAYGPGRYEVKMKLVPRFGACTAFWTFMYGTAQDLEGNVQTQLNQEIDIELNVGGDFHNVWFTNWHTEDLKSHVEKTSDFAHNDGEWHLYTFEWHTNPARVDYYIDNVHYYTARSYVPYVAGALNIGNWFPDSWAGVPDFEEDYMQIDYVRYTPYKSQPFTPSRAGGGAAEFPSVSTPLPAPANLISNGGFEYTYAEQERTVNAWSSYQNAETVREGDNTVMKVSGEDSVASQLVSVANEGVEYTVTAKVKLADAISSGAIAAYFLKANTEYVGSRVAVDISSSSEGYADGEYFNVTLKFTAPKGAKRISLYLECAGGEIFFDDVCMNMTNRL